MKVPKEAPGWNPVKGESQVEDKKERERGGGKRRRKKKKKQGGRTKDNSRVTR